MQNNGSGEKRVEKAYRELLSDYVYIDKHEGVMYEELMRDPWECTFQYVAEFGLRPTGKHEDLNADETHEYLKKNGGLDFEDIKAVWKESMDL